MAIRDWQKISKDRWRKKDNHNKQIVILKDRESGYEIIGFFTNMKRIHVKTKSEALKFAKAYMRKH